MSDPTTQATTTETPAEASPAAPDPSKAATPEERASLLKAALRAQPADVPTGDGETAEAQAAPVAEAAPVDAVAERRARLDALRQKERERAELRKKRAPERGPEPPPPPPAATEANAITVAIDRLNTVDGLLSLAEERGMDPVAFGEALRQRIANPERAISATASKMLEPVLKEAQQIIGSLKQREAELEQRQQQQQQAAESAYYANAFAAYAEEHAAHAPHAAALRRKLGDQRFLDLADQLSADLPESSGPQAILDKLEVYAYDQHNFWSGLTGPTPKNTSNVLGKTPPSPKAPGPVSNRAASERGAVVDEDAEWSRLSIDERAARLKARALAEEG